MRALVQRVSRASVEVDGAVIGRIGQGLLVLVGIGTDDTEADCDWLSRKMSKLRIFSDAEGKMNLDVSQVGGSILLVSQFTLMGNTSKGNRPSFIEAMDFELAEVLFERVVEGVRDQGVPVQTGRYGADMQVSLVNDGPVTILLESP